MTSIIILFGAFTLLAGIIITINPQYIFGFLHKYAERLTLHILAVVIRLLLGMLLIAQSDHSKFPLAIDIIGWLSIVAAIFLAIIGRKQFKRLIYWALSQTKAISRIGGIIAIFFGALLIYAFI